VSVQEHKAYAPVSVACFVLTVSDTRTEDNDRVKIQPLLYSIILNRAEQRLLKLYDKVKEAPFLVAQQEELCKFIEPIAVQQSDFLEAEPVVEK